MMAKQSTIGISHGGGGGGGGGGARADAKRPISPTLHLILQEKLQIEARTLEN